MHNKPMHKGAEKRKHVRLPATYITRYRLRNSDTNYDVSQTQNISQGGALLFTNRMFRKGFQLELQIQLPGHIEKVTVIAEVVFCEELTKNAIYKTRLKFIAMDKRVKVSLREMIERRRRMGER